MLQEDNVRQGFFEAEAFLAVSKQLPAELQPVASFAHIMGWRKEEVLALTWRQVDFQAETVRLEPRTTKNREGRTVFMTAKLRKLLEEQRIETTAFERQTAQIISWVFHRGGKPIKSFKEAWQSACKRAGYPALLLHDLRRTAVRNMIRAGIPERVAMHMAGHRTRTIFDDFKFIPIAIECVNSTTYPSIFCTFCS